MPTLNGAIPKSLMSRENFISNKNEKNFFIYSALKGSLRTSAYKIKQKLYETSMKPLLFFFFFFMFFSYSFSQSFTQKLLPNRSALTSTFNLFTDTLSGTCFAIENNGSEYLITAKHLFKKNTKSGDDVKIHINIKKNMTPLKAKVLFHPNRFIDIAVLQLPNKISQIQPLKANSEKSSLFVGQECIFLGFPLFNLGTLTFEEKIPFVKRALLSAIIEENAYEIFLLDGHNNPGFSGGPLITYVDSIQNQFIFGIIQGYFNQIQNVNFQEKKVTNQ